MTVESANDFGGLSAADIAAIAVARVVAGDVSRARAREACRRLLHRSLRAFLSPRPTEWSVERPPSGSPRLVLDGRVSNLGLGISHSGNWIAVGLSRLPGFGLDIQALRPLPRMEAIARYLGWPAGRGGEPEFWRRWSMVEAFAKHRGGSVLDAENRHVVPLADASAPGRVVASGDLAAFWQPLGASAMLSVVAGRGPRGPDCTGSATCT